MTRWLRAVAVLLTLAPIAVGASACKKGEPTASADPAETAMFVTEASSGLLLTWIDDKGDFHVETSVGDVPMMGRDAVRVVDPNKDDGTHADRIFVVDLRQAKPDGSFPVRVMTRADFEALAVARREKNGPTLASAAPPNPSAPAAGGPDTPGSATPPPVRPAVIIYGAEWCGACHEAARYLKSKGVPYIDKDVEKDPGAAREMQDKLAKSGMHAGSIPVIDVRGKIMVGFNPQQIDGALGTAL